MHLNQESTDNKADLDPNTGEINVLRGQRHPFESDTKSVNRTWRETLELWHDMFGDAQVSSDDVTTWQAAWPLVTFMTIQGVSTWLQPAGFWFFRFMANFNYIQFGFPVKVLLLQQIGANFFKLSWHQSWIHEQLKYEVQSLVNAWPDMASDMVLERKEECLQQMDYLDLLERWPSVKKNFQSQLREREVTSLQVHANQRATEILRGALKQETQNSNQALNKVLLEAIGALEETVKSEEVQAKSFDTAIKSLSGEGSAADDPLGSAIIRVLSENRAAFEGMSEEERITLVQLTDEQKQTLIRQDQDRQKTYLKQEPEVGADAVQENKVQRDVVKRFK